MDEVVDFDPASDHGFTQRGAVDGRVRTDLDVILDMDRAHVAHFDELAIAPREPEAVPTDNAPGLEDDASAQTATFAHDGVGPKRAVLAECGLRPDVDSGVDHGSGPDDGLIAYVRERQHGHVFFDTGGIGDVGERVDARLHRRLREKHVDQFHEREKGIWVYNLRNIELGNGLLRNQRSGSSAFEHLSVSGDRRKTICRTDQHPRGTRGR